MGLVPIEETTTGERVSETASPPPAVTFESLTFSDGTAINLDPNDIVVLVGPNNAGKSVALRELEQYIGRPSPRTFDGLLDREGSNPA